MATRLTRKTVALGLRMLKSKLQTMTIPSSGIFIAMDDEGRTHAYDALGEGADDAER
jgi:hypothetical protein